MQRRKFIAGVGSLAAAGAAGIGTGAFSQMSATRAADVNVVNDSNGLVALKAGGDTAVQEAGSGELAIDVDSGDNDAGINVNSRYQIGYPKNILGGDFGDAMVGGPPDGKPFPEYELSEAAFQIVNQDSQDHEVTVEYTANDPGGSTIWFEVVPSNGTAGNDDVLEVDGDNPTDSMEKTIGSGVALGVTILIDTRGGSTSDDLSGTLTVSAD